MTNNTITIEEMMTMPIGGIAKLSAKQLYSLLSDASKLLAHAKKTKQWIEAAIAMKYEEQIRAKRQRLGKDFGTINIDDDGFKITTTVPKKALWDQEKLAEIFTRIQNEGDDPTEYLEVTYKVPENKYKAWPNLIKKEFEPARTLEEGKPTYSLTPDVEEA